jgi:hypothetical protein
VPDIAVGLGALGSSYKRVYHEFRQEPVTSKRLGGAVTGAAGDRNILHSPGMGPANPLAMEWHVKGTQTILSPSLSTNGLAITQDLTDNDGIELTCGITARGGLAFVVGTDKAFYVRVVAVLADVSGCDPFFVGFRKAEAYQADWNDYADAAYIGVVGGGADVKTSTIVGGAATVDTDTTDDVADAAQVTFEVRVSAAGVVTYRRKLSASGTKAVPTTVAAYSFTSGLTVVPSIYFLQGTTSPGAVELVSFDCGHL